MRRRISHDDASALRVASQLDRICDTVQIGILADRVIAGQVMSAGSAEAIGRLLIELKGRGWTRTHSEWRGNTLTIFVETNQ